MLNQLTGRSAHYTALLVSCLTLVAAGGANLNCGGSPSPKTVASASVRDPDLRDPEGGLLWDRNNLKPAEVELSKTVTLSNGVEVPVTAWELEGAQPVNVTFDDPANPNVATLRANAHPLFLERDAAVFRLEFQYPVSGAKGEMLYVLRIRAPLTD